MPIYEYQCNICGHTLEAFQSIADATLTNCPECQKAGLQKIISATSFQLKGTGWYATDFKDKNNKKETAVSPNTEAKTETKTTTDTAKDSS